MSDNNQTFAEQLQSRTVATRVQFSWLNLSRAVDRVSVQDFAASKDAEAESLRASKQIFSRSHPLIKQLTNTKNMIVSYWKGQTLPYVEPGVRLLINDKLAAFVSTLEDYQHTLRHQIDELEADYESLLDDARARLGDLFDANDYPMNLHNEITVLWDFPAIHPAEYLKDIDPALYEQEQKKIQARFNESVELAESMFAAEFHKLINELATRLTAENAKFPSRKLDQIKGFIKQFNDLSIGSNQQLESLVQDLDNLANGVTKEAVKDDKFVAKLNEQIDTMTKSVNEVIEHRPKRRLKLLGKD